MVKLTEVEDEHYSERPVGLDGEVLLEDDDDDNYTDTGKLSPSFYHFLPTSRTPASNIAIPNRLRNLRHVGNNAFPPARRIPNRPSPRPQRHHPAEDTRAHLLCDIDTDERLLHGYHIHGERTVGAGDQCVVVGIAVYACGGAGTGADGGGEAEDDDDGGGEWDYAAGWAGRGG